MKKLNVALLVGDIRDIYSNSVTKGALKAAEDNNINLIIVPGRYFFANREQLLNQFEYQYQTLFSYCNASNVDLIIAYTDVVGIASDSEGRNSLGRFLKMINNAPLLTVSGGVEGIPNLHYDNDSGLKEGIRYMIKQQKLTRIAFVAGPRTNADSQARVEAYKDTLVECGLPIDDRLIIYGDFTERVKGQVVNLFRSYRDIKGVAFANDRMAVGGYEAMKELGLKVGHDVAILGYDNIEKDINLDPPLASVGADAEYIGYECITQGLKYFNSRKIENVVLPTQFILRDSLILDKTRIASLNNVSYKVDKNTDFDTYAKQTFEYIYNSAISSQTRDNVYRKYLLFILELGKAYRSDIKDITKELGNIAEAFNAVFDADKDKYIDIGKFMLVLENIKESFAEEIRSPHIKTVLSIASSYAYKRLTSILTLRESDKNYQLKQTQHNIYRVSAEMIGFSDCTDDDYAKIVSHFEIIGIKHSFMYLLKNPVKNDFESEFMPDDFMYLKAVQCDDVVFSPTDREQMVPLSEIFTRAYGYMGEEGGNLVMFNLFVRDTIYGIMLCDIPYEKYEFYESIIYQVSSALRILSLLRDNKEKSRQLNDSLELIKKNNIRLTSLSESDELTKVNNRRGFLHEAERMLKEKKSKFFAIGYADTDGLKKINDTYGHEMGDEAIIATSQVIRKALGKKGCMGRLGGDEFVVLFPIGKEGEELTFMKDVEKYSEEYNTKSGNPFTLSVSLGVDIYPGNTKTGIMDMLDSADKKMYHIKAERHKQNSIENIIKK